MEGDFRRVHAVYRALGLCEQREDRKRACAHGGRKPRSLQPFAHVCQAHVAVVFVVGGFRNLEADAGQCRVPMRVDGDGHGRGQSEPCERRLQTLGERGTRIQQRRGEHVAGDAAHRIEVEARKPGRRGRSRRHVRFRVRRCGGRCVVQGYSPLKTGLRFSANEATPSAKSADERSLP